MIGKSNIQKNIKFWVDTSDKDYDTMINLYKSKDYNWSLFIGQIVIEKLLKACIVIKTKQYAPYIHDLLDLAEIAKIKFSKQQNDWLYEITKFNLDARYDSENMKFYKKCTYEYTTKWIDNILKLRLYIKTKHLNSKKI